MTLLDCQSSSAVKTFNLAVGSWTDIYDGASGTGIGRSSVVVLSLAHSVKYAHKLVTTWCTRRSIENKNINAYIYASQPGRVCSAYVDGLKAKQSACTASFEGKIMSTFMQLPLERKAPSAPQLGRSQRSIKLRQAKSCMLRPRSIWGGAWSSLLSCALHHATTVDRHRHLPGTLNMLPRCVLFGAYSGTLVKMAVYLSTQYAKLHGCTHFVKFFLFDANVLLHFEDIFKRSLPPRINPRINTSHLFSTHSCFPSPVAAGALSVSEECWYAFGPCTPGWTIGSLHIGGLIAVSPKEHKRKTRRERGDTEAISHLFLLPTAITAIPNFGVSINGAGEQPIPLPLPVSWSNDLQHEFVKNTLIATSSAD
eukprot:1138925-Pelagomonas_calceolata.AAC.3